MLTNEGSDRPSIVSRSRLFRDAIEKFQACSATEYSNRLTGGRLAKWLAYNAGTSIEKFSE
ncbi:hypothetical protein WN55_00847 [Dufourea novaeangliae]|uniref:Uncharacterized protein n=1 Tax=Dufourea novaeangliae TaxID=178035 RepID=A0A154PCY7_DUFNO|nr:hypothetical protein WN55_00847 [Dufourea novaeangliae]